MKFTGKYDTIIESTITRYEQGGVLSGDLVRFRKDAMKNEKVKDMMENYKQMIEDAINTDLNLRVSAIKSSRPTTTGNYGGGMNSGTRAPTDYFVDIVVEYAPGLWRNPITVPIEVLEVVDTNGNLAPVPDSLKRKNKVHMPKKAESPDAERKTPDKNIKPQFPNQTTDGRTQIKKPVEVKLKDQGKLKKESVTLEEAYDKMISGEVEKTIVPYRVVFTQPYQATSNDLINKLLQRSEFNKDNTDTSPEWIDDKTMIIKIKGLDKDTVERGMTEVAKGIVTVTPEDELTSFGAPEKQVAPKGVVISGNGPSIGAA